MRLAICILTLSLSATETLGDMPPGWSPHSGPPTERDSVCGVRQQVFWRVYTVVGGIAVKSSGDEGRRYDSLPSDVEKAAPECIGRRAAMWTRDGYLVACDSGEFGGGLSWIARDGTSSALLCRWNVPFLIAQDEGAIALVAGCDLLGGGLAYRVTRDRDGKWAVAKIADLGSATSVIVRESPDSVLVGTWTGVWRVTSESAATRGREHLAPDGSRSPPRRHRLYRHVSLCPSVQRPRPDSCHVVRAIGMRGVRRRDLEWRGDAVRELRMHSRRGGGASGGMSASSNERMNLSKHWS